MHEIDELLQVADERKAWATATASSKGGQELSGLLGGSVLATEAFMTSEDLVHISGSLRSASQDYHHTSTQMRSDLESLDNWIRYLVSWDAGHPGGAAGRALVAFLNVFGGVPAKFEKPAPSD